MEFNIALNTIVYITIFIFPGIIFRKFYYIREYSKEFDKGNLFERFVGTIFASVIILCISFLGYNFIIDTLQKELLPHISYNTIQDIHQKISDNSLPSDIAKETYIDFAYLMLSIYLLSATIGLICYFLTRHPILKRIGLFKKINYWEDLVRGLYYKNEDDKLMYIHTEVDVLIDTGTENKLYSGKLENYYINHNDNHLQTITLSNVKRYKKDKNKKVEIKEIPGDHFIIEKERILNLNFRYIFEKKDNSSLYISLYTIIDLLCLLAIPSLIISLYFSSVNIYTSTILRKIAFVLCGFVLVIAGNDILKKIISKQFSTLQWIHLWIIIIFSMPYLWVFNYFEWYCILSGEFIFLFIIALFQKDKTKDK